MKQDETGKKIDKEVFSHTKCIMGYNSESAILLI